MLIKQDVLGWGLLDLESQTSFDIEETMVFEESYI